MSLLPFDLARFDAALADKATQRELKWAQGVKGSLQALLAELQRKSGVVPPEAVLLKQPTQASKESTVTTPGLARKKGELDNWRRTLFDEGTRFGERVNAAVLALCAGPMTPGKLAQVRQLRETGRALVRDLQELKDAEIKFAQETVNAEVGGEGG